MFSHYRLNEEFEFKRFLLSGIVLRFDVRCSLVTIAVDGKYSHVTLYCTLVVGSHLTLYCALIVDSHVTLYCALIVDCHMTLYYALTVVVVMSLCNAF